MRVCNWSLDSVVVVVDGVVVDAADVGVDVGVDCGSSLMCFSMLDVRAGALAPETLSAILPFCRWGGGGGRGKWGRKRKRRREEKGEMVRDLTYNNNN